MEAARSYRDTASHPEDLDLNLIVVKSQISHRLKIFDNGAEANVCT